MIYKIVVASSIAAAAAFAPDATVGDVKDAAWEALCVRSTSNPHPHPGARPPTPEPKVISE